MHKISVFILSLTILAQSTNFNWKDYWNLPILIEHLTEHLQSGDDLDSFMSLHYGKFASDHDEEHEEHEKLPFKHDHLQTNIQTDFFYYENIRLNATVDNWVAKKYYSYTENPLDLYINRFFQPPRK